MQKILEKVKDMEIMTHRLEINGLIVYQDFNCRFTTEGYLLFNNIVAPRGCYTHLEGFE